jgi:hypothetical protein
VGKSLHEPARRNAARADCRYPHEESTRDIPPEIIQSLETVARPGSGWALCVGIDEDARPKRRLSLQAKGSIRRKALERRVRKKAPLFADHIIAAALAANPKYFNPVEE